MTIIYESGDMGSIIMNWGLPGGGIWQSGAVGSEGYIKSYGDKSVTAYASGRELTVSVEPEDEADLVSPERAVYDHLTAEIEGRGKAQLSADDGIMTLATSMAAIKSGTLGRPVALAEILEEKPTIEACMG
jgi:predicted dehydrogenase